MSPPEIGDVRQRLDAGALLRELTHWVYDDDPEGPTYCGLDSRAMSWDDKEVDCPLCIAFDEGLEP